MKWITEETYPQREYGFNSVNEIIEVSTNKVICCVYDDKAKADLIASAPELLEQLTKLVMLAETENPHIYNSAYISDSKKLINRLKGIE